MRIDCDQTEFAAAVPQIEWLECIDSTNSELLRRAALGLGGVPLRVPQALLAGRQESGRGRAGRVWHSPAAGAGAANVYLSMLMRLTLPVRELAPLTLALGVAARRAISPKIALKWPNDLLLAGQKVGGILLEVASSDVQSCLIVAGIGVNVQLARDFQLDQPSTDLRRHGLNQTAAELAPAIVQHWHDAAAEFCSTGLRSFLNEYAQADALFEQPLTLGDAQPSALWRGAGVREDGALLLEGADGARRALLAGEVARVRRDVRV